MDINEFFVRVFYEVFEIFRMEEFKLACSFAFADCLFYDFSFLEQLLRQCSSSFFNGDFMFEYYSFFKKRLRFGLKGLLLSALSLDLLSI